MATGSREARVRSLIEIKPAALSGALDLGQGDGRRPGGDCRHRSNAIRSPAVKEDNTTQKLVIALALFAALSFAVWTGLATVVEAPAQGPTATNGLLTPF
jgi:hypothetical protein